MAELSVGELLKSFGQKEAVDLPSMLYKRSLQTSNGWQDIEWGSTLARSQRTHGEKFERMLMSGLQGKLLAELVDKNYLVAKKRNKDVYYENDPLQDTDMRKNKYGSSELGNRSAYIWMNRLFERMEQQPAGLSCQRICNDAFAAYL